MDQIEEVTAELQQVKGEQTIIIKLKEGFKETKVILTNQVRHFLLFFTNFRLYPSRMKFH